jgi:hypothetical protein
MTDPWTRKEVIGDCTLYLGDCLEVMPALGKVDAVVACCDAVVYTDKYGKTANWKPETPANSGVNMGKPQGRNSNPVCRGADVTGATGGSLRGDSTGCGKGVEANGDNAEITEQVGNAKRSIHRRDTKHDLQEDGRKDALQQVRGNGSATCASCGRGSHEQRGREFGSLVQSVSQQPPQTRVVEFEEGWAIITDPPYGIGIDGQSKRIKGKKSDRKGYEFKGWDKERPEDVLRMIALIKCPKIVWGGNYFADLLPAGEKWLSWDKGQRINQSDCELAYTNLRGALRVFTLNRVALMIDGAVHPTQKPVALMQWCLGFLPNAETILDPFMGSGTTLVACAKLGRKGIGIELDPDYFEIACKRVQAAYDQPDLFVAPPTPPTQEGMDL